MSWLTIATLAAIGIVALTCMALVWAALVRSSQISEQERRMERRLQRYVDRRDMAATVRGKYADVDTSSGEYSRRKAA